jgi:hypothetical protein
MEVKRGDKKYIEVGRSTYQSFDSARAEADLIEERLDLSCVVESMPRNSYKIFCRGAGYHELLLAKAKEEKRMERSWIIPASSEPETKHLVRLIHGFFSCSCSDFQFRHRECKHIKKVKMKIAGEKQKNKLPGVE